jgi:hypothetical protein
MAPSGEVGPRDADAREVVGRADDDVEEVTADGAVVLLG